MRHDVSFLTPESLFCDGKGEAGETSVDIPVFLHSSAKDGEQTVQYTPIVCKINPQTGGTTHGLEFIGISDTEKENFLIDYRRTFSYYNLGGPESHVSGTLPKKEDPTFVFLTALWENYFINTIGGTSNNTGSKSPMSYLANEGSNYETSGTVRPTTLSMALGYVNPAQNYGVTINPRKFYYDNAWADGLFIGQMVWKIVDPLKDDGSAKTEKNREDEVNDVKGAGQIFPLVIWFDPDYEN